jgi:hypothetical protein
MWDSPANNHNTWSGLWEPGGAGLVDEKWVGKSGECGPGFGTANKPELFLLNLAIQAISPGYFGLWGQRLWSGNLSGLDQ